ncbi:MAG TPA: hypothetical protein VH234_02250 [Candidatus Saccharimonadales bacterium]|jgi:hypothetical protein|nr:hypothetical protein [Candidatus Saccharimonadales bacterium]
MTGLAIKAMENQGDFGPTESTGDNSGYAEPTLDLVDQLPPGTTDLNGTPDDTTDHDSSDFDETTEFSAREAKEAQYRDKLFMELGRTANRDRPMPPIVLSDILKHLRMWEHSFQRINHQLVHRLSRPIIDSSVFLLPPGPAT